MAAAAAAVGWHAARLGAWCRRAPRLVVVLLLSVAAAAAVLAAGAGSSSSGDKVYLLNAMYSTNSYTVNLAKAIWLGMDAAFHHAAYTAAGGRRIEIVSPSSSVNQSDIVAVVEAALADYPSLLGVLGPYSDPRLVSVMSSATLMSSSLMFLAPFTGSTPVRTWNDNVYFTRAEPRLEIMAIVKQIASVRRSRRTAFMYLTGQSYGDAEYAAYVSLMAALALDAPALYTAPYSTTSTAVNTTAFNAMANTYPQVIVLWSIPGDQTGNFLEAVLTDPRTSSAYIITSFTLQQEVFQVYYNLSMAGKITPVAGQVMASATSFPLTLESTDHIPMFMAQMSAYMKDTGNVDASLWAAEAAAVTKYGSSYASASGSSSYADAFLHEHPNVAQLMLTGWISGTLVMQTLDESSYITSAAAYQAGLFEQHRYMIGGDFVLGDYGGPCNPVAEFLSAVCYCNQGGHAAFLVSLSNASWTTIADSGVNYTQNSCYSEGINLPSPLNFVTLVFDDEPTLAAAADDVNAVVSSFAAYLQYTNNPMNFALLSVTASTAQAVLAYQLNNYTTSVITGQLISGLDTEGYLVPAPLFTRPHLVEAQQNYVYLMPTLEQQFYLLYQNLAAVQGVTSIGSSVRVVLHGYESDEVANMTTVLQKSAATFNYDDPTVTAVSASSAITGSLVSGAINVVVAVTTADVAAVADFLASSNSAIVVVCFDDLVLQYSAITSTFSGQSSSVQARLLTFSSLPLWSDKSSSALGASSLLTKFVDAYPNSADQTPGKLMDVAITSFLLSLAGTMDIINSTLLVSNIYLNGVISVYGMTFGTFKWSCTTTSSGETCTYVNYGAQAIAMLSVQRMLDPTVPALTTASTPTLTYSPRRQTGLTAAQRSGVTAGAVVGGLALIAAVALLVYCCRDSRDNAAAPKEGREPVTLIFTDIESSTAMWAALPQLMGDAIAAHHRVIRQLIRKYGCYEVKTVGDSFMIACKDAYSAVRLVSDVQRKLLDYDWGTTEIDVKYREFELARVDTVDDYVPPTARLSAEEYAALWVGLRVRIGIHTGLSDIRYDEVTKGYDYYGDTSNMAARTEAIANGGQVVATETTWWALSHDERDVTAHTEFGPQGLRGVPFAVEMYQLNPVPGRKHAALRTEIEAILPDNTTETASSAAGALLSSAGTMTGAAAGAAMILSSTFAPYPPAQRVREMQPLLAKWNVGAPPRNKRVSEEDYCAGLINRLAVRVANVTQAKQRQLGADLWGGKTSFSSSGARGNPLSFRGASTGDGCTSPRIAQAFGLALGERSAMRESRLLQEPLCEVPSHTGESAASTPSSRRTGRTVQWGNDVVVPFVAPISQRESVATLVINIGRGSDVPFRSNSVSLDPVPEALSRDQVCRRRTAKQ